MKLKHFLQGFGILAIVLTLVPFIAINYWWIRIFDFPHLQLTALTLLALITYFIRFDIRYLGDYLFVIVLGACFTYQLLKITPYTPIGSYELLPCENTAEKPIVSFFTSNVYQENRDWERVVKETERFDADVVVFTETNNWWIKKLEKALGRTYPNQVTIPLDNTYGMILMSKHDLVNPQIKFLVDDSIPSIHTKLRLPNKTEIQLFAIHPTPPMPQENPMSTDRDAELMEIALLSRESKYPVVVLGDFNDVAWSESTQLFQQISGLLDMRKGRGLYNTYNAQNPIFRWPLDHIFTSSDFRFSKMALGTNVGSDHFPFFSELCLSAENAEQQKKDSPSQEQLKKAKEMVKRGKKEN